MRILYPLTYLYRAGLCLDKALTKPTELSKPVISVGNITWGGTGKTPITIKLAKDILRMGSTPCILSRGYKKASPHLSTIVSDTKKILASPSVAGDEPYMIATSLKNALVISGSDRVKSANIALANYNINAFILDDGFQHWKIKRDLDIVLISALNPFGNGTLIPSGILREPASELKRAGIIGITMCSEVSKEILLTLEETIRKHTNAPIVRFDYDADYIENIFGSSRYMLSDFRGRKVSAFCAIANPQSFKKTLDKHGIIVNEFKCFSDHYSYKLNDIKDLLATADTLIVTHKDAVKLAALEAYLSPQEKEKLLYISITAKITQGEDEWVKAIQKTLQYL